MTGAEQTCPGTMAPRSLFLFGLLFSVCQGWQPEPYQLLVQLFNSLFVDSQLAFEYEFGSGVPLLHGKAQVTINAPVELLPNSTGVSYPDGYTQLNTFAVRVLRNITISQIKHLDIVLSGCHIEMEVSVRNRSDWRIKPILIWVEGCSWIQLADGRVPPIPEQILPTLSQGLYNTAVELFQKDFDEAEDIRSDPSQNFKTFQDMFPVLMYLKGRQVVIQEEEEP